LISVTADSNIYISAFNFRGKPRKLLDMAQAGLIRLDVSDFIIEETTRGLREKFEWPPEAVSGVERQMRRLAHVVTPTQMLDVIKEDPLDNRILDCAAEAKSDYIVTGDNDLLRRGRFGDVPIMKVADFLEMAKHARGL
jgi:putative PIN family toxin of toxin-antitoxin system